MDYTKKHLNLAIGLGILILVLVLLSVFVLKFKHKQTDETLNIVKTEISPEKLPELFPADIPIEKQAKITQNYNATSPDGRFQATRTFQTNKALKDNLKIYQDFFKEKAWNIQTTIDLENYKMISATKGTDSLQVSIRENSISKVKTVDISFTSSPIK